VLALAGSIRIGIVSRINHDGGGLPNALPLSGGRPSAADHPLQRLVGRPQADHRFTNASIQLSFPPLTIASNTSLPRRMTETGVPFSENGTST